MTKQNWKPFPLKLAPLITVIQKMLNYVAKSCHLNKTLLNLFTGKMLKGGTKRTTMDEQDG